MKKTKFYILILTVLFLSAKVNAQEEEAGGSPYSIFGIGDIINYSSTRTFSMGIIGTSLFGNYINNLNPAVNTKLNSTLISITVDYGFLKSSDGTLESKSSNGNVRGINIGVPFDQARGWVLTMGFNPVSIVNYKIRSNGSQAGQNYVQTYSGKGGLSRINFGMAYTLFNSINLGAEYNYAFGEIKTQNFINFNNSGYTNTNIKKENDFQRSFMKGGAVIEIGKLFKSISLKDLSIGFAYQSGFNLSAVEQGIYSSSIVTDTVQVNNGDVEVPEAYGFGITNIFNRKYIVSADVLMQDWTKFSEFGSVNSNFRRSIRGGLGFEILPTPDKTSFWQSATYRFGGYYEKNFYKVSGQDVNSYGVRAGINAPISKYNSIDLGFNYTIRGKTGNGLIKDEFFSITAGVNFGELWFLRPREEDQ